MSLAGLAVEGLFGVADLIPTGHHVTAAMTHPSIRWNYTSWLNIGFIALAAGLLFTFWKTGQWPMLKMMGGSPEAEHDHGSCGHHTPEVMPPPAATTTRAESVVSDEDSRRKAVIAAAEESFEITIPAKPHREPHRHHHH